jgi:hypothetical protein
MRSSRLRALALGVLALASMLSLSCGNKQELVSITVQPDKVTFLGVGATAQLTALGNYIHPPATKDITSQVNWSTDSPAEVTVKDGLVTAINVCGGGNVIATSGSPGGSVVRGSSNVTIEFEGSNSCPVSLGVSVTGSGFVTSQPAGISCGPVCSALFPSGTSVTLSGSPVAPATQVTWGGCDSIQSTTNTCTVVMSTSRAVTATFQ